MSGYVGYLLGLLTAVALIVLFWFLTQISSTFRQLLCG